MSKGTVSHHSRGVRNDLFLQQEIKKFNTKNKEVEIINSTTKKADQIITVKIGKKVFKGQGKDRPTAVANVTEKIKNHKPTLIKRRVRKIIKKASSYIKKRA